MAHVLSMAREILHAVIVVKKKKKKDLENNDKIKEPLPS